MLEFLKNYGTLVSILASISIAIYTIYTARVLQRKRAAIDFFIRTETDGHALSLWNDFENSLATIGKNETNTISDDSKIRAYLNIFELVACGIYAGILDEKICRSFIRDSVLNSYERSKGFVDAVRKQPGGDDSYREFIKLAQKWK
jgi:hypothetical protein